MLRENQYILRQVNIALDIVATVAALGIAFVLRQGINIYLMPDALAIMRVEAHAWLLPAAPLATVLALAWNGMYQSQRLHSAEGDLARRIGLASVEATFVLMAAVLLLGKTRRAAALASGAEIAGDIGQTSTAFLLLLAIVNFALLNWKTHVVRAALMSMRRRGRNLRRVLLIGSGKPLDDFARALTGHPIWGLAIAGVVSDRPEDELMEIAGSKESGELDRDRYRNRDRTSESKGIDCDYDHDHERDHDEGLTGLAILCGLGGAPALLARGGIDEVVFVPDAAPPSRLRPLMEICEEMGLRTHWPLNLYDGPIARRVIDQFDEMPVLSYWPTRDIGPAVVFKYAFDRIAALILLVPFSIIMIPAALAIRLTSRAGEPVLFGQKRAGLNGRPFTCWKFRTMTVDAEARRSELEYLNEQRGPVFKIRDDPRVTPLGRWLRRFSIDELPQLWNVLRGEMSLVGPRPPLPEEVAKYDRWQRRRLSMKPGITCLWQVSGRNKLPFETWMKLDLEYIDRWSLWMDFRILMRTVWVVMTGYGAM